jgi:hypothetical protein
MLPVPPHRSIEKFHSLGAQRRTTEWGVAEMHRTAEDEEEKMNL